MPNPWHALSSEGKPISVVFADSREEADEKMRAQLQRPGRQDFWRRWEADGFIITEPRRGPVVDVLGQGAEDIVIHDDNEAEIEPGKEGAIDEEKD